MAARSAMAVAVGLLAGVLCHYFDVDGNVLTLYLEAPAATRVEFASSLDEYRVRPIRKTDGGTWVVKLPADHEFSYFYRVDDHVVVPSCRLTEKDDFGLGSCIYAPGS